MEELVRSNTNCVGRCVSRGHNQPVHESGANSTHAPRGPAPRELQRVRFRPCRSAFGGTRCWSRRRRAPPRRAAGFQAAVRRCARRSRYCRGRTAHGGSGKGTGCCRGCQARCAACPPGECAQPRCNAAKHAARVRRHLPPAVTCSPPLLLCRHVTERCASS